VKVAEAAQRDALRSSSSSAEWERQAADLRIEYSTLQAQLLQLEEEQRQLHRRWKAESDEAANVAKQLEQAQIETNGATALASTLRQQLETCQQELGQIKADERMTAEKAKWASKLAPQLTELDRQRRGLLADLQQERHDLEKARQAAQRANDALVNERKWVELLEAELSKCKEELGSTSPTLECPSDEAAIETLGAMLQRSIQQVPMETRQNFKRQLLLCFHPDRNPAKDVATRVTQILNCTQ
jgi:predicted  nucleic acid-binding Zn-ribbon protein